MIGYKQKEDKLVSGEKRPQDRYTCSFLGHPRYAQLDKEGKIQTVCFK